MIKFVKTKSGAHYNLNGIESFFVREEGYNNYCVFFDLIRDVECYFSISEDFKTRKEAQEWLDNFIEELEF
jgi:hypothetical protein